MAQRPETPEEVQAMTLEAAKCSECGAPVPPPKRPGGRVSRTCSKRCRKAAAYGAMRAKYEAELAAHGRVLRTCSKCRNTIAARAGTWPMSHGSPSGTLCFSCHSERQELVDERARLTRAKSPARQLRRVRVMARALNRRQSVLGANADAALYLGAETLNAGAKSAARQLAEAVTDPDSPWHREALEFFASRILPQKLYTRAGRQLARNGDFEAPPAIKPKRAPRVVVNVGLVYGPSRDDEEDGEQ